MRMEQGVYSFMVGKLSYREKRKLEKRYEDVKALLNDIPDYLRVGIVAYITLNMEKYAFIDLIDATFLINKSDEQLTGVLNTSRHVLGVI